MMASPILLAADDTWFNNPVIQKELWNATSETLLMTAWATLLAGFFGLVMAGGAGSYSGSRPTQSTPFWRISSWDAAQTAATAPW